MFPTSLYSPAYFGPRYWARPWFADLAIQEVLVAQAAADLHINWTSTQPNGTVFQLYVNRRLLWNGTGRTVTLPVMDGLTSIQVGYVPSALSETDFGQWLATPASTGDRARLIWLGGGYLDSSGADDVVGFHIYGSPAAGQAVSFGKPLATQAAYPGGTPADGFGQGGFGQGGFGKAASSFQWTSPRLGAGLWQFAVKPFDAVGNESASASIVSISIASPPLPPAPNQAGQRLTYTLDPSTRLATLNWLPSPG